MRDVASTLHSKSICLRYLETDVLTPYVFITRQLFVSESRHHANRPWLSRIGDPKLKQSSSPMPFLPLHLTDTPPTTCTTCTRLITTQSHMVRGPNRWQERGPAFWSALLSEGKSITLQGDGRTGRRVCLPHLSSSHQLIPSPLPSYRIVSSLGTWTPGLEYACSPSQSAYEYALDGEQRGWGPCCSPSSFRHNPRTGPSALDSSEACPHVETARRGACPFDLVGTFLAFPNFSPWCDFVPWRPPCLTPIYLPIHCPP